jgi:RHS repeat-associated protein
MFNRIIYLVSLIVLMAVSNAQAQVTYVHEDFHGSVAAESNILGQVAKRVHYEPFGEQRTSPLSNEAAHTGHIYDDDLDLSYMGARYYDPTIGRFYSDDPVGFMSENSASFNRYAYANNNPYAYTDPNGELPILLIPIIIAIAKEVAATAAETAIESATGVPIPLSTKSMIKTGARQLGKMAGKSGVQAAGNNVATTTARNAQTALGSKVPDSTTVWGVCKADSFTNGTGVTTDATTGKLSNVSVGIGDSVQDASKNILHSKVGVTTAGDIRAAGGQIVNDKGNHANVSGITAVQAAELFQKVVKNPNN